MSELINEINELEIINQVEVINEWKVARESAPLASPGYSFFNRYLSIHLSNI